MTKERTQGDIIQELTAKLDHAKESGTLFAAQQGIESARELVIGELSTKGKSREEYIRQLHVKSKQAERAAEQLRKTLQFANAQIEAINRDLGEKVDENAQLLLEVDRLRQKVTELGGDWV
jgi:chromosome segregation ATPase